MFDLKKFCQYFLIVFIRKQFLQLICVFSVPFSDRLIQERGKTRIAVDQPAAECD